MQRRDFLDARILVVDDEPEKARLVIELLGIGGYRSTLAENDSAQAFATFQAFEPDLMVLDFNMTPFDGLAVLGQIEPLVSHTYLPVLMLTGEISREIKEKALDAGAMDFLTRPFNATEILLRVKNLLHTRLLHLDLENERDLLEDRIRARTIELLRIQDEMLDRLALVAEYRDDATGAHIHRIAEMVRNIASEMKLPDEDIALFSKASLLHDLGKVGIADQVLLKAGRFTDEEMTDMKRHTAIGSEILQGSGSAVLQTAERIARYHHERWNGAGYEGLAGEAIPLEARITAVADVFDALTSKRPHKEGWKREAAIAEIERLSGSHFDPDVVEAFLIVMKKTPTAEQGAV